MKANSLQQMVRTGRPASGLTSLVAKLIALLDTAPVSAAIVNTGVTGGAGAGFMAGVVALCTSVVRTAKRHESRLIASKVAGFNWGNRNNFRRVGPHVAGG